MLPLEELFGVRRLLTVLYFLASNWEYAWGPFANGCFIVGTNIKPDTAYTITHSSPKHPKSHLAAFMTKQLNYIHLHVGSVELVNTINNTDLWTGGSVPTHMQWKLLAVEHPGWFFLTNRLYPSAVVTWNHLAVLNHRRYAMVFELIDPFFLTVTGKNRRDFLIRPYRLPGVDKNKYQLKMKTKPLGIIKWFTDRLSFNTYMDAAPMEIDMREPEELVNYQKGGELFQETLFTFHELPEQYQKPWVGRANREKCTVSCVMLAMLHYIIFEHYVFQL